MKEKLLFLGMLILSVLYWIEVVPQISDGLEALQYVGLAITVITVLPWLIGTYVAAHKKGKEKAAKAAAKEAKKTK